VGVLALKTRFRKTEKEAVLCFVVYEKEGKVFFTLGSKNASFIDKKAKIYYKVCTNLQN
jgi:hypothetical protein